MLTFPFSVENFADIHIIKIRKLHKHGQIRHVISRFPT